MKNRLLAAVEQAQIDRLRKMKVREGKEGKETEKEVVKQIDDFRIGDTVDVHQLILEGNKTRTQVFSGVVIAMKGGGTNTMYTVRRIVQGEGVERIFPLHSPKIAKVEVKRTGRVRRAKLYYLRDRVGKATRLRERTAKPTPNTNGSAKGKKAKPAPDAAAKT